MGGPEQQRHNTVSIPQAVIHNLKHEGARQELEDQLFQYLKRSFTILNELSKYATTEDVQQMFQYLKRSFKILNRLRLCSTVMEEFGVSIPQAVIHNLKHKDPAD